MCDMGRGDSADAPQVSQLSEALVRIAARTAQKLEGIWEEVGYEEEERNRQLESLAESFNQLCLAKINEEEIIQQQFVNSIAQIEDEIIGICRSLDQQPDKKLFESQDETLTERLALLESAVEVYRSKCNSQREKLASRKAEMDRLCTVMQRELEEQFVGNMEDLTPSRVCAFEAHLETLREEMRIRKAEIVQLIIQCNQIMQELRDPPDDPLAIQILGSLVRSSSSDSSEVGSESVYTLSAEEESRTCVGTGKEKLRFLQERLTLLQEERARRIEAIENMTNEINILYQKLQITPETPLETQDLSLSSVNGVHEELSRLIQMRRGAIGPLVQRCRGRILSLWEEIGVCKQDRDSFYAIQIPLENCDENVLIIHEAEEAALSQKAEEIRPILKLIQKRELIIRTRYEHEQLLKDSSRLLGRGPQARESLLREEKMSKLIKQLPRVTQDLIELIRAWEQESRSNFSFQGRRYLETIEEQENDWHQHKEQEKQKKKIEKLAQQTQSSPIGPSMSIQRRGSTGSSV